MAFDLLSDIEDIKTKITDNQYKNILDKLMKINTIMNELKKNNQIIQKRYDKLTTDYIYMSKYMLHLSLEREGINYEDNINIDIERDYQDFLMNNP